MRQGKRRKAGILSQAGIALCLAVLPVVPLGAQDGEWRPGHYMHQAVGRVLAAAAEMTNSTGFALKPGVAVLGAYVESGNEIAWSASLIGGKTYVILAAGDEDVSDLDVRVKDSSGKVISADTDPKATAAVRFRARRSGTHRILLKLHQAKSESFCAMAILQQGSEGPRASQISDVARKHRLFGQAVSRASGGSSYHEEKGQWALFGTVLADGESANISGMRLGDRRVAIGSVGDGRTGDLDLRLYTRQGKLAAKDDKYDSRPIILFQPESKQRYRLRITNHSSEGVSFAITSLLNY